MPRVLDSLCNAADEQAEQLAAAGARLFYDMSELPALLCAELVLGS